MSPLPVGLNRSSSPPGNGSAGSGGSPKHGPTPPDAATSKRDGGSAAEKSISNWGRFLVGEARKLTRNVEIRAVLLPAVADVLFHVRRHLEHVRKDLRRQFLVLGWFVVFLWPLYA